MKKSVALFIACVTLSLCGLIVTCGVIAGDAESVTLTEDVIYGDASLTDGLTVQSVSRYGSHMDWETTSQFSDGGHTDSTKYAYYQFATDNDRRKEPKVSYSNDASMNLFISYNLGNDPRDKLQQACQKWMEEFEPGSQEKHTIKLSDYYSYYPICANLSLPGERYSGQTLPYATSWDDFMNKFQRYFRIPVLDDEYLEITLNKSEDSFLYPSQSYSSYGHAPYGHEFTPYCNGVYTGDAYYFDFTNRAEQRIEAGLLTTPEDEILVDTSQIPGGYGVYRIPCVESERGALADIDGLSTVYAVDEHAQIVSLGKSYDNARLFLHTIEDKIWYLSVIDRESMTLSQKIEIRRNMPYFPPSLNGGVSVVNGDNFLLINFRDPTPEIVVLDERGDGYAIRQRIVNDGTPDGNRRAWDWWDFQLLGTAYVWDGERLAVVWNPQKMISDNRWNYEMCGVAVAVCKQGELQFFAEYRSSLDDRNGDLDGLTNLNMKMGLGSAGHGFFVTPDKNALRARWS